MISRARSNMATSPALNRFTAAPSAGAAARCSKLFEHSIDELRSRPRGVGVLVIKLHGLPFEGTKLMEGLHLDPLHILHRCDEPGDPIDVRGIVRKARYQGEPYPCWLAHCGQPLGEPQGWSQLAASRRAIGFRV